MNCKAEACARCTRRCWFTHRNMSSAPNVTSFFKVMFGAKFSDILYLPPKFAPSVLTLVNQDTFIEDSAKKKWKVTISHLEGSYAFEQGWSKFSSDHGLEIGDFLVFNYITGSHFYVQIYDASGCEKLNFVRKTAKEKRFDSSNNSFAKKRQCHNTDEVLLSKQSSSNSIVLRSDVGANQNHYEHEVNVEAEKAVVNGSTSNCEFSKPKEEFRAECTDLYCMINRDLGGNQEDRGCVFNLFDFEMMNNSKERKFTMEGNKLSSHAETSLMSQSQLGLANEDPEPINYKDEVPPDNAMKLLEKGTEKASQKLKRRPSCDNSCSNEKTYFSTASAGKDGEDERDCSDTLNRATKRGRPSEGRDRTHVIPGVCSHQSGGMTTIMKDEPPQMTLSLNRKKTVQTRCDTLLGSAHVGKYRKENISSGSDVTRTQQNLPGVTQSCEVHNIPGERNHQSGRVIKTIKDEPLMTPSDWKKMVQIKREMGEMTIEQAPKIEINLKDRFNVMVKSEPVDSVVSSGAPITCEVAAGRQSFLKLPTCLPTLPYNGMIRKERVVFLHDPCTRLWPVLYYERSDFQLLASGWEAFCKANDVQPGDKCVFEVENVFEGIYRVHILQN